MIGEQVAEYILDAIRSGRDLYLCDQFIAGPDRLDCAINLLTEQRDASADPNDVALLAAVICALEKGQR
jgi:hypothetical protein